MMDQEYTIPTYVSTYLKECGYDNAYNAMSQYIQLWHLAMNARGSFYDYDDVLDGVARRIHRRSIHPAARVGREWASLLLNDKTQVVTDDEASTEWVNSWIDQNRFKAIGQELVRKSFCLGTGAWAAFVSMQGTGAPVDIKLRPYDARMIVPLSWDIEGVSECAFVSRAVKSGVIIDQIQMHVLGNSGYDIVTKCWTTDGKPYTDESIVGRLETHCSYPTFALVKPAVGNDCVDLSPYGQSIYADAVDALHSVDMAYDAIFNEVDLGKLRIFIPDSMVDIDYDGTDQRRAIPFGRDNVIFRKVNSTDNKIESFSPTLRTSAMLDAYRMAWQTLGDLTGFGLQYFNVNASGGLRTATEVSSDNSALMRNIRKHENALEDSIVQIMHALLALEREFAGEQLPDEGDVHVTFDDSIIQDTAAEKAQDMAELNVTMNTWEYRMKWYGEDEETAKAHVPGTTTALPLGD